MTIDDQIRDEKLLEMILTEMQQIYQHYHLEKYEYIAGKEVLPPDQRKVIKQAKFAHSSLGKVLEKQTKTIEGQGTKINRCCYRGKQKTWGYNQWR